MNATKSMRTIFFCLTVFTSLFISSSALASNYKIVLIHGLQVSQLTNAANADVIQDGQQAWAKYWGDVADERIDWPAYERITQKITTDWVWPKLKAFSQSGLCQTGCIFVTHSTGDLVARHIIDNQANWLTNEGLTPLNIIATLDFAGAGGGSELADIAVTALTTAASWNSLIDLALTLWLGDDINEAVGVLHDLKVNNARQISPNPSDRVPRLRFVADADDFFNITDKFLSGSDDGVVATHSSCGASTSGYFGSCSAHVATSGHLSRQRNAVTAFLPNHYTMLMSDAYSHNNITGNKRKGKVTSTARAIALPAGNIQFATHQETSGWWFWTKHYRYVSDSKNHSYADLVYRAIP